MVHNQLRRCQLCAALTPAACSHTPPIPICTRRQTHCHALQAALRLRTGVRWWPGATTSWAGQPQASRLLPLPDRTAALCVPGVPYILCSGRCSGHAPATFVLVPCIFCSPSGAGTGALGAALARRRAGLPHPGAPASAGSAGAAPAARQRTSHGSPACSSGDGVGCWPGSRCSGSCSCACSRGRGWRSPGHPLCCAWRQAAPAAVCSCLWRPCPARPLWQRQRLGRPRDRAIRPLFRRRRRRLWQAAPPPSC